MELFDINDILYEKNGSEDINIENHIFDIKSIVLPTVELQSKSKSDSDSNPDSDSNLDSDSNPDSEVKTDNINLKKKLLEIKAREKKKQEIEKKDFKILKPEIKKKNDTLLKYDEYNTLNNLFDSNEENKNKIIYNEDKINKILDKNDKEIYTLPKPKLTKILTSLDNEDDQNKNIEVKSLVKLSKIKRQNTNVKEIPPESIGTVLKIKNNICNVKFHTEFKKDDLILFTIEKNQKIFNYSEKNFRINNLVYISNVLEQQKEGDKDDNHKDSIYNTGTVLNILNNGNIIVELNRTYNIHKKNLVIIYNNESLNKDLKNIYKHDYSVSDGRSIIIDKINNETLKIQLNYFEFYKLKYLTDFYKIFFKELNLNFKLTDNENKNYIEIFINLFTILNKSINMNISKCTNKIDLDSFNYYYYKLIDKLENLDNSNEKNLLNSETKFNIICSVYKFPDADFEFKIINQELESPWQLKGGANQELSEKLIKKKIDESNLLFRNSSLTNINNYLAKNNINIDGFFEYLNNIFDQKFTEKDNHKLFLSNDKKYIVEILIPKGISGEPFNKPSNYWKNITKNTILKSNNDTDICKSDFNKVFYNNNNKDFDKILTDTAEDILYEKNLNNDDLFYSNDYLRLNNNNTKPFRYNLTSGKNQNINKIFNNDYSSKYNPEFMCEEEVLINQNKGDPSYKRFDYINNSLFWDYEVTEENLYKDLRELKEFNQKLKELWLNPYRKFIKTFEQIFIKDILDKNSIIKKYENKNFFHYDTEYNKVPGKLIHKSKHSNRTSTGQLLSTSNINVSFNYSFQYRLIFMLYLLFKDDNHIKKKIIIDKLFNNDSDDLKTIKENDFLIKQKLNEFPVLNFAMIDLNSINFNCIIKNKNISQENFSNETILPFIEMNDLIGSQNIFIYPTSSESNIQDNSIAKSFKNKFNNNESLKDLNNQINEFKITEINKQNFKILREEYFFKNKLLILINIDTILLNNIKNEKLIFIFEDLIKIIPTKKGVFNSLSLTTNKNLEINSINQQGINYKNLSDYIDNNIRLLVNENIEIKIKNKDEEEEEEEESENLIKSSINEIETINTNLDKITKIRDKAINKATEVRITIIKEYTKNKEKIQTNLKSIERNITEKIELVNKKITDLLEYRDKQIRRLIDYKNNKLKILNKKRDSIILKYNKIKTQVSDFKDNLYINIKNKLDLINTKIENILKLGSEIIDKLLNFKRQSIDNVNNVIKKSHTEYIKITEWVKDLELLPKLAFISALSIAGSKITFSTLSEISGTKISSGNSLIFYMIILLSTIAITLDGFHNQYYYLNKSNEYLINCYINWKQSTFEFLNKKKDFIVEQFLYGLKISSNTMRAVYLSGKEIALQKVSQAIQKFKNYWKNNIEQKLQYLYNLPSEICLQIKNFTYNCFRTVKEFITPYLTKGISSITFLLKEGRQVLEKIITFFLKKAFSAQIWISARFQDVYLGMINIKNSIYLKIGKLTNYLKEKGIQFLESIKTLLSNIKLKLEPSAIMIISNINQNMQKLSQNIVIFLKNISNIIKSVFIEASNIVKTINIKLLDIKNSIVESEKFKIVIQFTDKKLTNLLEFTLNISNQLLKNIMKIEWGKIFSTGYDIVKTLGPGLYDIYMLYEDSNLSTSDYIGEFIEKDLGFKKNFLKETNKKYIDDQIKSLVGFKQGISSVFGSLGKDLGLLMSSEKNFINELEEEKYDEKFYLNKKEIIDILNKLYQIQCLSFNNNLLFTTEINLDIIIKFLKNLTKFNLFDKNFQNIWNKDRIYKINFNNNESKSIKYKQIILNYTAKLNLKQNINNIFLIIDSDYINKTILIDNKKFKENYYKEYEKKILQKKKTIDTNFNILIGGAIKSSSDTVTKLNQLKSNFNENYENLNLKILKKNVFSYDSDVGIYNNVYLSVKKLISIDQSSIIQKPDYIFLNIIKNYTTYYKNKYNSEFKYEQSSKKIYLSDKQTYKNLIYKLVNNKFNRISKQDETKLNKLFNLKYQIIKKINNYFISIFDVKSSFYNKFTESTELVNLLHMTPLPNYKLFSIQFNELSIKDIQHFKIFSMYNHFKDDDEDENEDENEDDDSDNDEMGTTKLSNILINNNVKNSNIDMYKSSQIQSGGNLINLDEDIDHFIETESLYVTNLFEIKFSEKIQTPLFKENYNNEKYIDIILKINKVIQKIINSILILQNKEKIIYDTNLLTFETNNELKIIKYKKQNIIKNIDKLLKYDLLTVFQKDVLQKLKNI